MKKTCWICICGMIIAALLPVSWQMILKDSRDESRYEETFNIFDLSWGCMGRGKNCRSLRVCQFPTTIFPKLNLGERKSEENTEAEKGVEGRLVRCSAVHWMSQEVKENVKMKGMIKNYAI